MVGPGETRAGALSELRWAQTSGSELLNDLLGLVIKYSVITVKYWKPSTALRYKRQKLELNVLACICSCGRLLLVNVELPWIARARFGGKDLTLNQPTLATYQIINEMNHFVS